MGLFGKSKRDAKLAEEMAPYILDASALQGTHLAMVQTVLGRVMSGDYTVVPNKVNLKLPSEPLGSDELNWIANKSEQIVGYVFFNPDDLDQTDIPPSPEEFGLNIFHVGCDYLCNHQLSAIAPVIEKKVTRGKGCGIMPPTLCENDEEVAKFGDVFNAIKSFWPTIAEGLPDRDTTFIKGVLNHRLFDVSGTYQEYTAGTAIPYSAWIAIA